MTPLKLVFILVKWSRCKWSVKYL